MESKYKSIITEIVTGKFGQGRNVEYMEHWGGGAHNRCFKVGIDNPHCDLFIKVEKEEIFPRTRRCQIEREFYGNKLAASAGIPCPQIHGYSFDNLPARYIIQEFIDGKLLGEQINGFSDEEKQQIAISIRNIADRLQEIKSDVFGEVFEEGILLQHKTWKGMLAYLSGILIEDAAVLGIFSDDEIEIITKAHASALQTICYSGSASLVHLDLHEFNIFSDNNCRAGISKVIDFGFVLFMAPYVSYYGPQGFSGNEEKLCGMFGMALEELKGFDIIFSLEFVAFVAGIRFAPDESYGYKARKEQYIAKCKAYLRGNE